mgnify:CR=1 FL=1
MSNSSIEQNATNGQQTEFEQNPDAVHPKTIIISSDNETEELIYTPTRNSANMTETEKTWMGYIAKISAQSKLNTQGYKEADYIIMMIKAYEMGLPFTVVTDGFYIINGKIALESRVMLSLLQSSPLIEDVIFDEAPDSCTVTIKRKGKTPYTATFTMKDAEKAQLLGKVGWKNYPNQMLAWRALSKCARRAAPDILGGLGYTKEELMDEQQSHEPVRQPSGRSTITVLPNKTSTPPNTPEPDMVSMGEDPLSIQPNSNLPTESALSGEPDPNDPEDIRHAIPVYGADHWYVTNDKNFIKTLRKFVDGQDAMLNHEVSAAGLRFLGIPTWQNFASGKDALVAVETKYNTMKTPQTAPTPQPTSNPQLTPKPAPTPTPQPATPPDWVEEFESFAWTHFDIAKASEWEAKAGKKLSNYASFDEATKDATRIALENCWDLVVDKATYFNPGGRGQTYIIFKGLGDIRMYGRSTVFKKDVGDDYYARYGVGEWQHGQLYAIGLLKVSWKRNEQGTAIADKVEVLDEEDEISSEELLELASVEM